MRVQELAYYLGHFTPDFAFRNQVSRNPDTTLIFAGTGKSILNPLEPEQATILKNLLTIRLVSTRKGTSISVGRMPPLPFVPCPITVSSVLYKTFTEANGGISANWDLNIARYSSSDQLIFDKRIISSGNDYGTAIKYDTDGHLYISGFTDLKSPDPTGLSIRMEGRFQAPF
jgi:hypothetical protein